MLSRIRPVLAIAAGALLLLSQPAFADDPAPPGGGVGVGCGRSACGVNAYDKGTAETRTPQQGSQGAALGGSGSSSSGNESGTSGPADPNACGWRPLPVNPIAGSVLWHGGDAASGSVEYSKCAADPAAGAAGNFRFVPNAAPGAAPVAPPPPTPEELAQQAYQQLPVPVPSMHFGPDDTKIAVRYWLYLWLDDPGAVTATATAGAVSVTATARLSSVTWTMGEPVSAESLYTPAAPITCQGLGVNPGPGVDTATVDPAPGTCAYMYQVRSTLERTGGTGTWPVTATATWTITWAANTGQSGALQAPPRVSTMQLRVGAWSTVMVADGEAPPNAMSAPFGRVGPGFSVGCRLTAESGYPGGGPCITQEMTKAGVRPPAYVQAERPISRV